MHKTPGFSWEMWFIGRFFPMSLGRFASHIGVLAALWALGTSVYTPLLVAAIMAPPCYLCAMLMAWVYNHTSDHPVPLWVAPARRGAPGKRALSHKDIDFIEWMRQHGVSDQLGDQFIKNW